MHVKELLHVSEECELDRFCEDVSPGETVQNYGSTSFSEVCWSLKFFAHMGVNAESLNTFKTWSFMLLSNWNAWQVEIVLKKIMEAR